MEMLKEKKITVHLAQHLYVSTRPIKKRMTVTSVVNLQAAFWEVVAG